METCANNGNLDYNLIKTLLPFVLLIWKGDICTSRTETFQMIPNMSKLDENHSH